MKPKTLWTLIFVAAILMAVPQEVKAFCNAGTAYGFSDIAYDDASNIVVGYSATELDYCAGLNYDPYVEGYLYDQYDAFPKDFGYSQGYADYWAAEVITLSEGIAGTQYTVLSDHYVIAYFYYSQCGYYDYYGGCNYYDNYWYDPWGFDFMQGGYYGSWWNFFSNFAAYYYYYQYYYIGSTGDSLVTPSFCVVRSSSGGEAYAASSDECGEQPEVKIVFDESGVPLAASPPSGSGAVVDTVTMKAEGNFLEGSFNWSVIEGGDKVQLSNTTSEVVSIKGVKESGKNEVKIKVVYRVNGDTAEATRSVTVQKPTAMKFVNVREADSSNAAECADFPNTAGRQKTILWRVVDQHGDNMTFSMPLSSTMETSTRENNCRLSLTGVRPDERKRTDSAGAWPHRYHFCTGQCTGGRTCTTTGNQRYNINGFALRPIPFSFSCGGISVGGDGSTAPRPARASAFISQSVPSEMVAGESYNVAVTIMNTGTETWSSGASFRLGSQNEQDNYTWGVSRIELPAPVPPDGEVTFNFLVTAPPYAGTYNFQWAMVQDGVTWFGEDTENVPINVTQPFTCNWWAEQNCYNQGGWWDYGTCTCYGYW